LKHASGVFDHVVVPKTDYPVALACQTAVSDLVRRIVRMLSTVNFYNQPAFAADEIDDVRTDRLLAGKLEATEPPITQRQPQHPFHTGAMPAQRSGNPG